MIDLVVMVGTGLSAIFAAVELIVFCVPVVVVIKRWCEEGGGGGGGGWIGRCKIGGAFGLVCV